MSKPEQTEQPKKQQETNDEVDLGQLFNMIGRGFERLFNFVGRILKGVFELLISLLLIVRRHFVKICIIVVSFGIIGYVADILTPDIYGANMLVKPNFESTNQLYNNIQYYHAMVESNDTVQLSEIFGITRTEAAQLRGFYIEPLSTETNLLVDYVDIRKELDSAAQEELTFELYKENIEPTDYRIHQIGVASLGKRIYKKIDTVIINAISENNYFKEKQKVTLENIRRNDSVIKNSIAETDSLRIVYERVLIAEAEKKGDLSGTSIVLSENTQNDNRLARLLERKILLKNQLNSNDANRVESMKIMNVLSEFPEVGYVEGSFFTNYKIFFPVVGVTLYLLFLILYGLNKYLVQKEAELKENRITKDNGTLKQHQ